MPAGQDDTEPLASRREVLVRGAGLLATTAAFAGGWAALRDPRGEKAVERVTAARFPVGGFAVPDRPGVPVLVIVRGGDPSRRVRAALDAMGGASRFVQPGDRVILKPNVAFDRPAALGATTDPEVLAAVARAVVEAGAREVRVLDNPINSPEGCFVRTGIRQAALDSGARVILPSPAEFRLVETEGATVLRRWPVFFRPFADAQRVIGIAPLKDHNLAGASMTMKNWYGLLGGRRNQLHQDLHTVIAELALLMRPTLVVLDATRVLMRNGPTGGSLSDVRHADLLIVSTDQVAADACGYELGLEREPSKLASLELAAARGLGRKDWRALPHRELTL